MLCLYITLLHVTKHKSVIKLCMISLLVFARAELRRQCMCVCARACVRVCLRALCTSEAIGSFQIKSPVTIFS